jgi:hypothetical protein
MKNLLALLILAAVTLPASAQTIRKGSDGSVTVFHKDGTSDGLAKKRGVTDGSNACVGCIGEFLFVASGSITSSPASLDTYTDVADLSLTLTPGDWDLEYSIALALGNTGVTGALFGGAAITDASNNVQTQSVAMTSAVLVSSGDQVISTVTKSIRVSISSTTTYKVRIRSSSATAGSVRVAGNSWTGSFTNPDNASTFYARRASTTK